MRITHPTTIGINIVTVCPSLCSPHGSWLNIGMKGGKFLYLTRMNRKERADNIPELKNPMRAILSALMSLKNSLINHSVLDSNSGRVIK